MKGFIFFLCDLTILLGCLMVLIFYFSPKTEEDRRPRQGLERTMQFCLLLVQVTIIIHYSSQNSGL